MSFHAMLLLPYTALCTWGLVCCTFQSGQYRHGHVSVSFQAACGAAIVTGGNGARGAATVTGGSNAWYAAQMLCRLVFKQLVHAHPIEHLQHGHRRGAMNMDCRGC